LEELERLYLRDLMRSEDAREGIAAFLDKRRPAWKNH
jgi:cyclohexa-1,5-dienecarbonyl-CoA hydratase